MKEASSDSEDIMQQIKNKQPDNLEKGNDRLEDLEPNCLELLEDVVKPTISAPQQLSPKKAAPKWIQCSDGPRIQEAYNILKTKSAEHKDECSIFGEYVAEKLRKMTPRVRATVQHQISTVFFNTEVQSTVQPETISTPEEAT